MAADSQGEMTFEQALARLEQVVRELETGECTLDQSLVLFQEGVRLTRFCQQRLDEAEARVERLLDTAGDEVRTEPFEPGADT